MFNFSGSEIVFLLLLALIILGPDKLPDAVRKFGKGYAEFKKVTSGFQEELKSALDEPMREMRETADAFKQAASFDLKLDPNAPNPLNPFAAATAALSGPTTPPVPTGAEPPIAPAAPAPAEAPTGPEPSILPLPALEPDPDAAPPAASTESPPAAADAFGPLTASPQGDDLGASAE